MDFELLTKAKSLGFSDRQIAHLTGTTEDAVRAERKKLGLVPSYRLVDTCAAEFEAYTPYYYSTYDRGDDEIRQTSDKRKLMILGGGPNRMARVLNSITAVFMRHSRSKRTASRRSWSIPTLKPSRPITTPATNFFSSPSRWRTCC